MTSPINPKSLTPAQAFRRRKTLHTALRTAIQIFFFLLAPGVFTAAFSGIKGVFTALGTGASLSWTSFAVAAVGICGYTVVFGRFFCGYACAFGALGDWIYALSSWIQKKSGKKLPQLGETATSRLQWIKYLNLALICLTCFFGVYSSFSGCSPWDVFSRLTGLNFKLSGYAVGSVLFLLILLGMAWKERFFCQFLCPMGAVFALLPVLPWSNLRRDGEKCLPTCGACHRQCPVSLSLDGDSSRSGECIRCGKCAVICPRGAVRGEYLPGRSGGEWQIVAAKALLLFLLCLILGLTR
jgi:polyferredoxin